MAADRYEDIRKKIVEYVESHDEIRAVIAIVTEGGDVWHDGRFLDRWADPEILRELKECFAHYDKEDCMRALKETHRLFARISRTVAEKRSFQYPRDAEDCAAEYLCSHET